MEIRTIEERLATRAKNTAIIMARDAMKNFPNNSNLQTVLRESTTDYSDTTKKTLCITMSKDWWAAREVIHSAMVKCFTTIELERLRAELLDVSDNLNQLIGDIESGD